jgi:hypothetical protein
MQYQESQVVLVEPGSTRGARQYQGSQAVLYNESRVVQVGHAVIGKPDSTRGASQHQESQVVPGEPVSTRRVRL